MKKATSLIVLSALIAFSACKSKTKNEPGQESGTSQQTTAAPAEQKAELTNLPKEYKATFTPDSAILGKKKEALVKINGASAIVMQDPDGKDKGIEFVVKLTLTNKEKIGEGSGIHVDYPDSRLQLDNGNNIVCQTGTDFLRADPESTSKEESWTFDIPAGAKPKALNLFMDGTRVSVAVSLD